MKPPIKTRDEIRAVFRSKSVPLTHQRLAVFETLSLRHDHPSAESLYESLRPSFPSLSLATVYKTLQMLHEMGMIARVDSPSAQARYDAIVDTHHHALCVSCGKIQDVFDSNLNRSDSDKLEGFVSQGHSVHFHGLCAHCTKSRRPTLSQKT